jgi:antitoxin (DNA-binding transcriptional repressor) of toxin-antitoxin stability system
MLTIDAQRLGHETQALLLRVREHGESFLIVDAGRIVARLGPAESHQPTDEEAAALLMDLKALTAEIGTWWPEKVSAVEAVREGRRVL